MKPIGQLQEINRYPVKSMIGHSLQSCRLERYGLYADRSHVIIDETRQKKFLTAREVPALLQYKADLLPSDQEISFPDLVVTSPDQQAFQWGSQELVEHLSDMTGREVSFRKYSPVDDSLLAVDDEHILLITTSSLRELEKIWGKPLDRRRFRANFVLDMAEDEPFVETSWIGETIRIGEIELQVNKECVRCVMITMNPDDSTSDMSLLQTVAKERKQCFGVYASVVKTGEVKVGDSVVLHR